jgi:hypothetical protein
MSVYLLHGLIIRTIGWLFDIDMTSMIFAFILSMIIVALTAQKRLFTDMFKEILEWGSQHKQVIQTFRTISLLIIFAVYGYFASPLILEAKTRSIQQNYENNFVIDDDKLSPDVVNKPETVFNGFNWDQLPSYESKGLLTDSGSVVYDYVNRKPRVEYGEVYNVSLGGKYLSYDGPKFVLVDESMNLKIDFIEIGQQIGIELLDGRFLTVHEGAPVIGDTPTPLDFEVQDRQVAFKYNVQYLSIDSDELVFVSEPVFWDVELEVIDDSPLTYFAQVDERWGNDAFASTDISMRGCGLVSMAMILNYELDSNIDVDDMIALDRKYDLGRNDPPRINVDQFAKLIDEIYEVNVKKIKLADIPAEINSGRLVYYHTTNNPSIGYKNLGHIIVIYGITENGRLKFLDPYPGNISQIPADEALQYFGQIYSFSRLGIPRSDAFTGYITLDAMAKSSGYTAYSIWR